MKNTLASLIIILMVVGGSLSIKAQISFNISTGVGSSGPLSPGNADNNYFVDYAPYLVCPIPAVSPQEGNPYNVLISTTNAQARSNNWQPGSFSCGFGVNGNGPFQAYDAGACQNFLNTSVLPNYPGCSWIQPPPTGLTIGGNGYGNYVNYGIYQFGYTFYVPSCYRDQPCANGSFQIQNCTINLKHLAVRGNLLGFWINNNWHSLSANTNSPILNQSININYTELNASGPNILDFVVQTEFSPCSSAYLYAHLMSFYTNTSLCTHYDIQNYSGICGTFQSMIGLNIEGDITVDGGRLQDANGNPRSSFCMNEDVFVNGGGSNNMGYKIELYANGGTSPLASTPVLPGSPSSINLTTLLKKQNYTLTPGSYTLKLLMSGPCGWFNVSRDFSLECCEEPDASFELSATLGSQIEASSSVNGTHTWNLYSAPYVNKGPYAKIKTASGNSFTWGNTAEGLCYYVTHEVINDCGQSCTSQQVCNLSCETAECIISAPNPVQYDPASLNINWTPVTNAAYYQVELVFCDPRCCGNSGTNDNGFNCGSLQGPIGQPGPISSNPQQVRTIRVDDNINYQLTPADYTVPMVDGFPCFSIKVYAVCANGDRSAPSDVFCSTGNPPAYKTASFPGSKPLAGNQGVRVFPNPANDQVSIDLDMMEDVGFEISIFDRTGMLVKTFEPARTLEGKASTKWNVSSLEKGLYLVKVSTSDNQVFNTRLIIN